MRASATRPTRLLPGILSLGALAILASACSSNSSDLPTGTGDASSDLPAGDSDASSDRLETDAPTSDVVPADAFDDQQSPQPPEYWQWVVEDFEQDILQPDNNHNGWETEGKSRLTVVQNAAATWSGGGNQGYLRVTAAAGDVSMLKLAGARGGNLDKVSTSFYLNVQDATGGKDTESSVAAFRKSNGEALGFLRLQQSESGHCALTLRQDSKNATETIQIATGLWYKLTLSYDASVDLELRLLVEDTKGTGLGSVGLDSPKSGVETIQYGKVGYEDFAGEFWLDDVAIVVPALTDVWVAETGDDQNSGFSAATPLKSLSRATRLAGPGTTLHLLPGTYQERVLLHYGGVDDSGAPLSLRGEGPSPSAVVLEGAAIALSWGGIVHVSDTKHVRIGNLTVRNSGSAGVFVQRSEDVAVQNVKTEQTQMSGLYVEDSRNISLLNNEVNQACQILSSSTAAQENITLKTVSFFDVQGNVVHGGPGLENGGEGICVKGYCDHGLIHRNRVYDLPGDVGIYLGVGSLNDGSVSTHHILVYQNEVSTGAGIAVSSEYGGTVEDIDIFNNLVHDQTAGGIQITQWQSDPSQTGALGMRRRIRIFNNTVVNVGTEGVGGGIHLQCADPAHVADIQIRNNILSGNQAGQLVIPDSVVSVVTVSNNLLFGEGGIAADSPLCSKCLQADPRFLGSDNDPFDLQGSSPAIDVGAWVEVDLDFDGTSTPLSFDYAGRMRPVDHSQTGTASYDLGAYESP